MQNTLFFQNIKKEWSNFIQTSMIKSNDSFCDPELREESILKTEELYGW